MRDLALDPETHDLLIQNFDLVLNADLESVRQAVSVRLQFFYGEWFLDITEGIKYYEYILVKNPDLSLVSGIIKTAILNTPNVKEILDYSQAYDSVARSLTVSFRANTDFGELTDTLPLGV